MITKIIFTKEFDSNYKKLTQKNRSLEEKVKKKIEKIAENPETGVPKRYDLKGVRGVHVNPFVITYVIIRDAILFITINHHDLVYGETSAIYSRLMDRYPDILSETPGEERKI